MHILHLISSSGLLGAERVVIELSKGLQVMHNCHPVIGAIKNIYNPHTEIVDEAIGNNINSVVFPCKSQFDIKLIFSIKEFIKNNRIDIVHCHGYKSNLYGLLASQKKIPSVTTNHNWLKSHWKLKVYCFLDNLWIRYFDRIVAVSEEIRDEMIRYKIPEKKIRIIDNGIDVNRFDKTIPDEKLKRELGLNGNCAVIGTIGSLKYEKGHEYLLKAAKEVLESHAAIKFLIVGGGPLRNSLEDEAKNLGIAGNVIFTGYRKDVAELLSVMDIFVLPSVKEGLPMVLLEAMAAKKPIIATRVGAVSKVIRDNETGILVEPGDVSALQRAIGNLLNDTMKTQGLALKGYGRVKKDFSSENMCREYLTLYKELLSQ